MNRMLPYLPQPAAGLLLLVTLLALTGEGAVPERSGAMPADPAELLPASTLAYLEFSQPAAVARELSALLKGSAFEDMPAFLSQFHEKYGDQMPFWFNEELAMLGVFLGPEGLAEASRFKAGFVALTGFTKDHEPEVTWVLLPGSSNMPGFILRAFLSADREIRVVEKVDDARLYREYSAPRVRAFQVIGAPPAPPPPLPVPEFRGPTFALLPGAVVIGSNPFTVRDVVLRARGKPVEQTLASVAAFKQTAKLRARPGLFAYADLRALATQLEAAYLGSSPTRYEQGLARNVKLLTSPQALGTAAASLSLQKGVLDLQAFLTFDPKQDIPWLSVLPDQPVSTDLLAYAPADSTFALALSLSNGKKRWDKLLALADRVMAGSSLVVRGLEDKCKVRLGPDVFARISGAELVWRAEPGGTELSFVSFQAPDAVAAQALEDALVQLVRGLQAAPAPRPSEEEVQGQRIRHLPANAGPGPQLPAYYYGRHGAFLAAGLDKKAVAGALAAGAKKQGLLGQPDVAEEVQRHPGAVALGVWSVGRNLAQALGQEAQAPRGNFVMQKGGRNLEVKDPQAEVKAQNLGKLAGALTRAVEPLPPAVLSLTRQKDRLILELRQAGLPGAAPAVVNVLTEWELYRQMGRGMVFQNVKPVPPPPPMAAPPVKAPMKAGKAPLPPAPPKDKKAVPAKDKK